MMIVKKELISIIAPCYNVEKTLSRYLNSILGQTYKNIEVIAINDGSSDNTEEILKKYILRFSQNNMYLKCINKKNEGLGAAINAGLKYVQGEYLCWSDPDDFYMPTSMEKRLEVFHKHPEYAVVSSDAYVFKAEDLKKPVKREAARFEHRYEPGQFELLLKEESHFCAGCHMIRMRDFEKVNPEREIFPAKRGQNWQLLLPLYYKFKRYYLDIPLYAYIIYPDSMSSGDVNEQQELQRWCEHEEILRQTLNRIPLTNEEARKYNEELTIRYAQKRFYTAIDFRDKKTMKEQYEILKKRKYITQEIRDSYLRNYYIICKIFYKCKELLLKKYV